MSDVKHKIIASGVCLTLALSLAACGGQWEQEPQDTPQTKPIVSESPATAPSVEDKQEIDLSVPSSTVVSEERPNASSEDGSDGDSSVDEANIELFTEVNETVWAIEAANLHSGPGTDNDKVGSLNKGQQVVRTGIGAGEADGWSEVTLSDGSIVYVASSCLSITEPAQQSTREEAGEVAPVANLENELRPEIKEAIDLYGAFVDEYVGYCMEYDRMADSGYPGYTNADIADAVTARADYGIQYAIMSSEFQALWDNHNLNDAEKAYYLNVQQRVLETMEYFN